MDDEEHGECGYGEDDHALMIKIEYEQGVENEEGTADVTGAAIHAHLHNVPPQIAAQTLIILAHKWVADDLAHDAFEGLGDRELAHRMAYGAASVFLAQMVKQMPQAVLGVTDIPDDISELLEGQ